MALKVNVLTDPDASDPDNKLIAVSARVSGTDWNIRVTAERRPGVKDAQIVEALVADLILAVVKNPPPSAS